MKKNRLNKKEDINYKFKLELKVSQMCDIIISLKKDLINYSNNNEKLEHENMKLDYENDNLRIYISELNNKLSLLERKAKKK